MYSFFLLFGVLGSFSFQKRGGKPSVNTCIIQNCACLCCVLTEYSYEYKYEDI